MLPILSSEQLRKIQSAMKKGLQELDISLDLNLTKTKVKLDEEGFYYDDELIILPKIRETDKSCYIIEDSQLKKLQFMSEETNFLYQLIPTSFRPILKISGTSMHKQEFIERIEKDKLKGFVLDSGTGLGYTAIIASKTASKVITIEYDPNVIEMQKLNPYSQELFKNPKIERRSSDLCKEIVHFSDSFFDFIILDGGTPHSSGNFFSLGNYKEVFRVLKEKGRLYHYLPDIHKERGRDFKAEIISRLKQSGFKKIEKFDSYVIAYKN